MALMEQETTHCKAMKKNGDPCQGKANGNGYCMVHSPTRKFNPVATGQKGGRKSANTRRARADLLRTGSGREYMRARFESDDEWMEAVVQAYRRPVVERDKGASAVAGDFLAQTYGKPVQNIQSKHEVSIVVVSRLDAALEQAADVDLPDADVRELTA